ncbi:MAG TPA: MbcA/ParS/Xre antitoxin family protein [Steroidobacteraceae bacterium]|nr:MbcA/ParS/Xre antitoxin family protein [Steroidobacteraceae bacterium]
MDSLLTARSLPENAGAVGLRAFIRIAELWHLTVAEQLTLLGLSSRSTYFKWRKDAQVRLPRDTLERISYVLGIYKALQLLLPDTRAADEWVRRPNEAPLFGGRSALQRMLSGQVADLYLVRQYLDAQRG